MKRLTVFVLTTLIAAISFADNHSKVATLAIKHSLSESAALVGQYIEMELTELNTRLTDLQSMTSEQLNAEEILVVEVQFIQDRQNVLKARVTRLSDGLILKSLIVSTHLDQQGNPLQADVLGASIARRIVTALNALNYDLRLEEVSGWSGSSSETRWSLEDISSCKQHYLIRRVEDGFPGTRILSLQQQPTARYAIYAYAGVANLQRQVQWIDTLLRFEGLQPHEYKIISNSSGIRVIFISDSPIGQTECGE